MPTRMFVALDLPRECREHLAAMDPKIRGLRWLEEDQLHLTLAFLGDVENEARDRLSACLATVRVPPFRLHVEALGTFGRDRPTVVWAGLGSAHPHLFALHKRVHDALLGAGFDLELRSFKPHITVARARNVAGPTLRPLLRAHADTRFYTFEITGFALFSSRLLPDGSEYQVEKRWEFDAP